MSQVEHAADTAGIDDDFEALLNESFISEERLEGRVVHGTVVAIEGDAALVDVGLKTEGRVALKEFGAGKDWTYEDLNGFLWNPKKYVSGTAMGFAGVKKTQDRADLIAYLRTLADSPAPLPEATAAASGDTAPTPEVEATESPAAETPAADAPATEAPAADAPASGENSGN